MLILSVLRTQPARFNDLKRRLDGITHKAFSEALRRLERNGLISRPAQPIGVEYAITDLGGSLREPSAALCKWSLANGFAMSRAQLVYDINGGNGPQFWTHLNRASTGGADCDAWHSTGGRFAPERLASASFGRHHDEVRAIHLFDR